MTPKRSQNLFENPEGWRAGFGIRIYKIRGASLSPEYREGDFVVCVPSHHPQPGAVVVFDHPEYGRLIKRVNRIEADGKLFVSGDDIDSIDSRRFGAVAPEALRGRVIWHIRKR